MKLTLFKEIDFLNAVKTLFKELNVPINYVADEPTTAKEILKDTYKANSTFALVDDVYFVGMVDDAAFEGNQSLSVNQIKSDYDGVLIFGITLNHRENNLLPTRSQLAEISRAFNREFYYTPVVLVFKYQNDDSDYLAFANTERLKYKQEWREGEKVGKVSLLRDININNIHSGHERIINELKIPISGIKKVDSFAKLYNYWQEVFSVSVLNKKFYQELQNWYFWAIKEVNFPNQPKILDENIDGDEAKLKEAIKEHKGKNVIRLLTRILFIWFIKEKKLIPEEIFDEQTIADKLIDDFTPQKPHGLFSRGNTITKNSKYYRAILQNLFFATLNQEMGKRTFRNNKQHQNVTNLMRYKSYFKDPAYFVNIMENVVPFMNGGLFECLDKPHPDKKGRQGGDIIIYTDGFSDRPDNSLFVPDYLFFDVDEDVDLSDDFGSKAKVYKNAKTRGLLEILKSYKFTITENTPIEEDVALDPELLGKVFENLLASYNPETKTTARKQTGSFYTPREIVNYMVDESLIAYLKNVLEASSFEVSQSKDALDTMLHQLFSFDETNPIDDKPEIQKQIIKALDNAKILDPAAGSGAFPMGILQKMVHVLHKIDPNNIEWKQRQIDKVNNAIESLETIDDEKFREQSIKELKAQIKDIEDAFENNELDYGRKLFLIENCIYGVDIQSIATQISKLRFFISLIVDQKIDKTKPNFGIRPLPNLETKFVAANTLIGIDKPKNGEFTGSLFDNTEVKKLEAQLKKVRHKLFSSKSPRRKRELREEDKNLREQIAMLLEEGGMENLTARQLASWDPYDQNASSPFFDPEWMFDIKNGFDVVIGNPPYVVGKFNKTEILYFKANYKSALYQINLYMLFTERSHKLSVSNNGIVSLIVPNTWLINKLVKPFRSMMLINYQIYRVIDCTKEYVFDATVLPVIFISRNKSNSKILIEIFNYKNKSFNYRSTLNQESISESNNLLINYQIKDKEIPITEHILAESDPLAKIANSSFGVKFYQKGKGAPKQTTEIVKNHSFTHSSKINNNCKLILEGKNIERFKTIEPTKYIEYGNWLAEPRYPEMFNGARIVLRRIVGNEGLIANTIRGDYCNNSLLHVVKIKSKSISNNFLLGILNSRLIGWFFIKYFARDEKTFPEIRIHELNSLPIKITKEYFFSIQILVSFLKNIYSSPYFKIIDKVLDSIIFNLYFPEHMKERGIDVLQFVEQDIASVWAKHPALQSQKPEAFDTLSDAEKEEVIEQLHQIWTDPNNEVVKRMSMFKEKSPDILKIILES